jgi:hypothetical protein
MNNDPQHKFVRRLATAMGVALIPLACGSSGNADPPDVETTAEAASGSCPVTITIPSQNEAVGASVQISVTQSCSNWTNAMIAYLDQIDCSSSAYPYPSSGCHTAGGAQNFSTSTWIQVTPGKHTLLVNNWDSKGDVSVSSTVTFTYAGPAGLTIASPAGGATVSDPVTVTASASETVSVNQMQLWDNGTKLGFYCNAGENAGGGCNTSTSPTMTLHTSLSSFPTGANALTVIDLDNSFDVINTAVVDFNVSGSGVTTDPVLVGAGDIGEYGGGASATGKELQTLVADNAGALVFTLGDNAYGPNNCDQGGSTTDYSTNYTNTGWGALIGKTLPMPGNHEYNNCDLSNTVGSCSSCGSFTGSSWVMDGYWPYFNGHAAVSPGGGTATSLHYGYDFTTTGGKKWRYESVDSGMCFYTNNCGKGTSEYSWLANELASHSKAGYNGGAYAGVIVATHIDRFDSAGCPGGGGHNFSDLFDLAVSYKVDLFIDGHVHGYERFAQLGQGCQSGETASGCPSSFCGPAADTEGPVLIDLGSGGADSWSGVTQHPLPNSLVRIASTFAVGRIRMHDASWDFTLYDTDNNVIDGLVTYPVH